MFTLTWPKILLAFTSPGAPGSCSTCLTSTPGLFQQNCYPGWESQHAAASCHTTKAHLLVWHKYMCVLAHVRFSHIFSHVQAIHQLWEALPLLFCNEPHTNTFKHLSTLVQNHKPLVREKCTLDKKFRCNKQVCLFCSFCLSFISSVFSSISYYRQSRILWIIKNVKHLLYFSVHPYLSVSTNKCFLLV